MIAGCLSGNTIFTLTTSGVTVADGVYVLVKVLVGATVAVLLGVNVAVLEGTMVGVLPDAIVAVFDGATVGVLLSATVAVFKGAAVGVLLRVAVAVLEGVMTAGVFVYVRVAVGLGTVETSRQIGVESTFPYGVRVSPCSS